MKKTLPIILIAVLVIGILIGVLIGTAGDKDKGADSTTTTTTTTTAKQEPSVPKAPEKTSEGLAYELDPDGESYTLVGIGNCADSVINIPSKHEGKPVTAIGEEAFMFNDDITELYIPDSISEMGENAFSYCGSLELVSIGAGLKHVPKFAFTASGIRELVVPDTVTSFDYTAFWNCESLESIYIGKGVKSLGASWDEYSGEITFNGFADFSGCKSLVSITVSEEHPMFVSIDGNLYSNDKSAIVKYAAGKRDKTFIIPEHVTEVSEGAFYGSVYLEEMNVPSNVKKVSYWAFQDSKILRKISFGAGVTDIEWWAVSECSALEEISVEEGNPNYKVVEGCLLSADGLTFIQYPLGSDAEKFTIPAGVEKIETNAFSGANNLLEIVVPEGVKLLSSGAFSDCERLKTVQLPSTLENIDSSIFCFSYELSTIVYNGTKAMWDKIEKSSIWDNGTMSYTVICDDATIKVID